MLPSVHRHLCYFGFTGGRS